MDNQINHLRDLIAKDQLLKVVRQLKQLDGLHHDDLHQVILLSRELYALQKLELGGQIQWEEKERAKSRIAARILDFICWTVELAA